MNVNIGTVVGGDFEIVGIVPVRTQPQLVAVLAKGLNGRDGEWVTGLLRVDDTEVGWCRGHYFHDRDRALDDLAVRAELTVEEATT